MRQYGAELAAYVAAHKPKTLTQPLFYTQRRDGFTPNTLIHIVNGIYRAVGISGTTPHSGRRTGLTNLSKYGSRGANANSVSWTFPACDNTTLH